MKIGRSMALAALAAGALALGTAASAQDAKQPGEEAKPEAKHEHGGNGMHRMGGQHGGCHGQSGGAAKEHNHS